VQIQNHWLRRWQVWPRGQQWFFQGPSTQEPPYSEGQVSPAPPHWVKSFTLVQVLGAVGGRREGGQEGVGAAEG
jgi:hypothetical protein